MLKEVSMEELQKIQTSSYVRLFEYIMTVSKEIGEEKAWKILENIIKEKRLNWFKENKSKLKFVGTPVEQGYNIFYFDYLKLDPKDVKVIERSENKITTRWYNFCPVLETCKTLGLDTRKICEKVYDKPVQIFLSQINRKLKFRRNYKKIRPHTNYCEETIELGD